MYGLIGKKLTHSFSADFFNKKFQREGINESYSLFPLKNVDELPDLLKMNPELKGLNVTIPYKQDVFKYLDNISKEAAQIGAVNVIKITKTEGKTNLEGFNSDYIGFRDSLKPLLSPDMTKALVLGTGGASKAVRYVLNELGFKVTSVSRKPSNDHLSYNELTREIIERNLLIVNTTPLGMFPDIGSYPDIPYQYLSSNHLCYDLVYNPLVTRFMEKSQEYGAKVKNGLEMLELQALASWDIWNS